MGFGGILKKIESKVRYNQILIQNKKIYFNTFTFQRLHFEKKINELFCLENASKLTHEFFV